MFPGDIGFRKGPVVEATLTDDTNYLDSVIFDASLWFEQSDNEILMLAEEDWGGGYEADNVAEFFASSESNPRIVEFFADMRSGFEVHVDEKMALAWIKQCRPRLQVPPF